MARCWHHHHADDHWGLETPTAGAFSHPEGTDVTSFSSRIAHVLQTSHMREHTLAHHCVCVLCLCACVLIHSGHMSASAWTAHLMTHSELVSFLQGRTEKRPNARWLERAVLRGLFVN